MDRRTLLAVILIGLFLVLYYPLLRWTGLDRYMGSHPPRTTAVAPDTTALAPLPGGADSLASPTPAVAVPGGAARPAGASLGATPIASSAGVVARAIRIATPLYDAEFSSRGARLVSMELKRYASAHGLSGASGNPIPHPSKGDVPPGDRVVLEGGPTFGVDLGAGAETRPLDGLVYAAEESLDAGGAVRAITFTARDTSGFTIRQTYRVRPDDYALDLEVEMHGIPAEWRVSEYSLTARSWPLFTEGDLPADHRSLKASSLLGTNLHRESPGGLLRGARRFDGSAVWAGVHTRYFFAGVAARDAATRAVVSAAVKRDLTAAQTALLGSNARPEQETAISSLVASLPSESRPRHHYLVYVGPNEYARMASYKVSLERTVDLGWSWILPFSKALLALLNFIFGLVKNYGLAIVALATIVRLVLHPLNMASMKSMRSLQRLQPEIERIRAKYKNDAQAMNTATMALYKENKVNPAGGCLPMVVQMPIFFALYAVLFNAIELRQEPFVGWIRDLSAPDLLGHVAGFPIRLLPLLMAGSGLLQQKMTPTDPRQAPTMYLMNVMMLVFFYNLPSGLVLYWTVMNLLTALQQWLVMRQDGSPAPVVATAGAGAAQGRRRG